MFSVFHPDAHDLFNTCSDLKKVAWELWDPERCLNDQVHLFFCLLQVTNRVTCHLRIKPFNYSEHLPRCFASDQQETLKSRSRTWRVAPFSLRKSWTAREFSCISAATNTFTAQGRFCVLLKRRHLSPYKERKGLYVSLWEPRRDRQLDALY